jgi:hypothetical protein
LEPLDAEDILMSTDAAPQPDGTDQPVTDTRKKRPRTGRGQKPMVLLVGIVFVAFALTNELQFPGEHGPLWRLLVAILAFLYLWWLSSQIFDLVFIWHRYIQGDAAHRFLRAHVQRTSFRPKDDPPSAPSESSPTEVPPLKPSGGVRLSR